MMKQLYFTLSDGTKVFIVDGTEIRREIDDDFIMGGNGYAYDYCPQDEIWLERLLDENERFFIFTHERIEMLLMRDHGYDYDSAHMVASGVELATRRHETNDGVHPNVIAQIQNEFLQKMNDSVESA